MRLTKIKLSGFKTFVDSTSLSFPSNLTGIIGPNGCGKSNIIDAIRWVMGESSARNLRGDSMDDVIFSGSSSRSQVSKAFIELYFDNENNTLDAKFAKYSEIVIRIGKYLGMEFQTIFLTIQGVEEKTLKKCF